ncbi:MAG: DUF4440 domain-containing protein, partial [Janthinobacterium lividum]
MRTRPALPGGAALLLLAATTAAGASPAAPPGPGRTAPWQQTAQMATPQPSATAAAPRDAPPAAT